jgi:carbon-monoxide dehydrogenase medium subunit
VNSYGEVRRTGTVRRSGLYPAAVDYVAPRNLDEALRALAEAGEEAKVISGGQSLIPLLRLRFAAPSVLVDVRHVPEMRGLRGEGNDLVIGALTCHADLLDTPLATGRWRVLKTAAGRIADPQVRNLGTIGGALSHADPEGDWASVMLALRAQLTLASVRGTRTVPIRDFYTGIFTTVLESDEVLTSIRLPGASDRSGADYLKLSRRVGDFASVGVATALTLRERGLMRKRTVIEQAGIALTALGPINFAVEDAEQALLGNQPTDNVFTAAAELAANAAGAHDDARGSADHRRAVVRAYVWRGLRSAAKAASAI